MSGTSRYSIRRSNSYARSLTAVLKDHYQRDKEARGEFADLLEKVFIRLEKDPQTLGNQESWPKGTSRQGWDFRKLRFDMPGLRGASRCGRLMFLIDFENREVIPLLVYTHKKHTKRPHDKQIKRAMEEDVLEETD